VWEWVWMCVWHVQNSRRVGVSVLLHAYSYTPTLTRLLLHACRRGRKKRRRRGFNRAATKLQQSKYDRRPCLNTCARNKVGKLHLNTCARNKVGKLHLFCVEDSPFFLFRGHSFFFSGCSCVRRVIVFVLLKVNG
jgi:hypothetical protein